MPRKSESVDSILTTAVEISSPDRRAAYLAEACGDDADLRAQDPKLNRIVAVKVLAPEFASNPTARKRFLREARAAAAVSHPHVVTIHAVEDANNTPYLVMEFINGQSL